MILSTAWKMLGKCYEIYQTAKLKLPPYNLVYGTAKLIPDNYSGYHCSKFWPLS